MDQIKALRGMVVTGLIIGVSYSVIFLGMMMGLALDMVLAALGLVSVGAIVVGVLVSLSFAEEGEEDHN